MSDSGLDGREGRGDARPAPRVLVIEDDAPLRNLVAQALELDGMHVAAAADPAQALALCADGAPYSVVLLDWGLGRATGREFAAAYRALPGPHAPIVLVTGAGDVIDNAEAIGARGFLKKPFDLGHLVQTIGRLVGNPAATTTTTTTTTAQVAPVAVDSPTAPATATGTAQGPGAVAAFGDERRRLLERIGAEAAAIQNALPGLHASTMALAEVEGARRLTLEERNRRRDLRLQMEAHHLRLQELRAEFETLRANRPR